MSVESFRTENKKYAFYYFITAKDFDKSIDWQGRSVKNVCFERGLVDEGLNNCPTRYSAYGKIKEKED